MHKIMSTHRKIEKEFSRFSKQNFQKPSKCRNTGEIQFYIQELTRIIEQFRSKFNYVPNGAYSLLDQYNQKHKSLVFAEFKRIYSPEPW